jgi:hypothetical protein
VGSSYINFIISVACPGRFVVDIVAFAAERFCFSEVAIVEGLGGVVSGGLRGVVAGRES